ncbi:MAG: hypothetical protein M5U18_18590 [Dehalococcoidia bacterium]|nr:hypothetical protein [Dehalococcoidia bacterium]
MSNSTAGLYGLPTVLYQEQVTARTEPLWGAQPTVLKPSVPPPQAPVPLPLEPPPVKENATPCCPQVEAAACIDC